MLQVLIALVLHLAVVFATLYILETYFPTLHRIVRAAIIVFVISAFIGLLRMWICGWLCM